MHRRLSPLFLGTALSVSILSSGCSSNNDKAKASPQATPVRIETLKAQTISDRSEFVGNLEAVKIVEVRPEIEGRIEKILVRPGQKVTAGQSIMVLKPGKALPQHKADLANVDVAKGNRENALKQLDIAKAKRDTAKTELDTYNVYVPRVRNLVEQGGVAQVRLDEVLQKQIALKNNLIAVEQEIASAEVSVRQAEDKIRQAQAQANTSLVSVQSKEVYAPIAGTVDALPVNLGDYVSAGQSVVAKVAQTEDLFLNIAVPSNHSSQLKTGMIVELIDPNTKKKLANGRLTFISPTVNTEGQTILTKARFRNVDGHLRDGQNVQARMVWNTQKGLLIPTTAISRVGGKEFVYLVYDKPNKNGQEVVRLNPVELGDIEGSSFQVVSGLKVGDRVAVSNILKLRDGVPIQPKSES